MTNLDNEKALIQQVKAGEQKAFGLLVEHYQASLYRFCYRKLYNMGDAEDAVQETLIRAYYKLEQYDENRPFATWLFAIAAHCCIDKLRRAQAQTLPWDDLAPIIATDEASLPEGHCTKLDTRQEVQSLVKTLPPIYRQAVVLKYWEALSYQEIALKMDTTVNAIKGRLFRAKKMMAQAVN